ncbi:P-loop NTPase family protein [Streptomyces sp. S6]
MRRIVVLGRGGAGKSVLARRLGVLTGLPVIELDRLFWGAGPEGMPARRWAAVQEELVGADGWIMDGDLGPYDVPEVRLRRADTVVVLDFSFWRCAWRAGLRGRERGDFWRWVWGYRRRSLVELTAVVGREAGGARVVVVRGPGGVRRFLAEVGRGV